MQKNGRPRHNPKEIEARKTKSIRITPTTQAIIEAKYGQVQKWVDECFKNEFGEIHEAEIVRKSKKEEITEDDF